MTVLLRAIAWLAILATGLGCASTDTASRLRIVSWNIHHGRGLDGQVDLDRIAAVLNDLDADVIALQEVDVGTTRTQQLDIPAELARRCGMHPAFGRNIEFQGGGYGNAILARGTIHDVRNHHYRMLREGEQRGALQARLRVDARDLIVVSTHLDYRPDDAERLQNVAELGALQAANVDMPMIICGDLNAEPGSPTLVTATGELRIDSWQTVGHGLGHTYPAGAPRKRIDYVLLPRGFGITPRVAAVRSTDASDHLPLVVDLELR